MAMQLSFADHLAKRCRETDAIEPVPVVAQKPMQRLGLQVNSLSPQRLFDPFGRLARG